MYWLAKSFTFHLALFFLILEWEEEKGKLRTRVKQKFDNYLFVFKIYLCIIFLQGTDLQNKKTTKQEYYCFLVEQFCLNQLERETKLYFLPIGRNKIVHQEIKNILHEILVSLLLFCKSVLWLPIIHFSFSLYISEISIFKISVLLFYSFWPGCISCEYTSLSLPTMSSTSLVS